ncbi:MAG: hypothetical protein DWQ31_06180 [Planctomycetota bacterium]|nr:MAG: hypothetical protein DWQ31_06180 [Planctomycetota bacterium]REJ98595.1 MAG: hypothetical protein DWQ35_00935 [Planctomycetota bacterium]REK29895.1 MAG: hypothetical protein DWQ42_03055 [Planctomycetota bacterium]REK47935.1 MAG: hypothetical protein DWQ46_03305 [Planctomycetota bacterium]
MAVWPAVDEYLAVTADCSSLEAEIVRTEKTVSSLAAFRKRVEEKVAALERHEAQAVSPQAAREFRARLVSLARQHNCQIRRINLSDTRTRKWRNNDRPIEGITRVKKGRETRFDLRTQQCKLMVMGPLPSIIGLLEELQKEDRLIYASGYTLRPSAVNRETSELEIELTLFDLEEGVKPSA